MNESLVLVTSNTGKAAEFSRLLGIHVEAMKIPLPEVQGLDVRDVAKAKALAAFQQVGRPVLVDDSGIEFIAWSGLPGALTSWFMDTVGNDGLIQMLQGFPDRSARVITALGYCSAEGAQVVEGVVSGHIADAPAGTNGFGYDPIFVPSGAQKTFAEMSNEEKDDNSMRAIACAELQKLWP
jgi:non-canonical purine NTP pyrophosphatase (RdgB/HAM1 family)